MPTTVKPDTTPDGGAFISGGRADLETGKHYGGRVVDAEGRTLKEYGEKEENLGRFYAGKDAEGAPRGVAVPIDQLGLAPAVAAKLKAEGYTTADHLAAATDEELDALEGFGAATVKDIRTAVKKGKAV
jgi:DNA-directed RNA polymerase alpha subunit